MSGGRCFFCGFEDDTVRSAGPRLAESFCHACLNIAEFAGLANLIYLPSVPQADFNLFMRTVYVALVAGDDIQKKEAANMYNQLVAMAAPVKRVWGTADAGMMGQALERIDTDAYQKRTRTLRGLVFMPLSKMLSREQVNRWLDTVYVESQGLAPKNWRFNFMTFFVGGK